MTLINKTFLRKHSCSSVQCDCLRNKGEKWGVTARKKDDQYWFIRDFLNLFDIFYQFCKVSNPIMQELAKAVNDFINFAPGDSKLNLKTQKTKFNAILKLLANDEYASNFYAMWVFLLKSPHLKDILEVMLEGDKPFYEVWMTVLQPQIEKFLEDEKNEEDGEVVGVHFLFGKDTIGMQVLKNSKAKEKLL